MKKMKKTFACLLDVLLIFGIMPTGVFADETSDGASRGAEAYEALAAEILSRHKAEDKAKIMQKEAK